MIIPSRFHAASTIFLLVTLISGAVHGEEANLPWSANHHPTDTPKNSVQNITTGKADYVVKQGGTMDGQSCRTASSAYIPHLQTWESNRSVRMENIGDTDVINPWLTNGKFNFRSVEDIVASAIHSGMPDKDKAQALWWQEINFRFHSSNGDNDDLCNVLHVLNCYGFNTCGNDSICVGTLLKKAGLKSAPCRANGHCISQAFFDGGWHLFDGDMNGLYLLRDNLTIAGDQDVFRDRDLVRRTHTEGISNPDSNIYTDAHEAALYSFEGPVTGDRGSQDAMAMNMTLRPGEALVWRWGHLNPIKAHAGKPGGHVAAPAAYSDTVCNGLWEYRPDFTKEIWKKGAISQEGITSDANGLSAEKDKTGTIVWAINSPYVFVGGKLEVEGQGAKFALSWDGKSWADIAENFDGSFSAPVPARYGYQLRCQLTGDARIKRLAVINDVQMAPLPLPAMTVGDNKFTYSDQSTGDRKVRITHDWVERSATKQPEAPSAASVPADGSEIDGTDLVFQWKAAKDPDGDAIADYHFELSAYADMRWPVSMSFAKYTSKTADAGKPQYTLLSAGLLNPDVKYYWHVQAQDDKGVWGPWSKTWSFTAHAPTYPLNLKIAFDDKTGTGKLQWQANPLGRKPAKYRVYGSDEKGFTANDKPYQVIVGTSQEIAAAFPANFIAEVSASELAVLGSAVDLPAANKTYYRVVAVDEKGKRSGSSEYATAPRPTFYSKPVLTAKIGAPYKYQLAANRSIGDLTSRANDVMNFWEVEKPKFAIQQGPAWLAVDAATGVLSGTPDAAGKVEVIVTSTIDREVRKLDDRTMQWGNEKVNSTSIEKMGPATQKFVIEVK